jgi:hypothetical protein
MTIEQIEHEALSLPLHLRARLAERLISSLDEEIELEREWLEEAERRLARIETGETQTRPAASVLRDARTRLENR